MDQKYVRRVLDWRQVLGGVCGGVWIFYASSFQFPFHRAREQLGVAINALDGRHFALVPTAEHRVLELVL